MDEFQDLLSELHRHYDDSYKVETIINKVSHYFTKKQNDSSTDLLIFLLFGENGITSFLNKILTLEAHKPIILNILSLFEFLLVNYEKFCIPYVNAIKKLCLGIVENNVPAKIKENSLKLLKCVFVPSFIMSLDLSDIMNRFVKLRDNLSPSAQGQLFSVIGIVFEKMPEIWTNQNEFFNYFIMKINDGGKASVSVIAGCLDGINGYLVNFTPNSEQISKIYSYLKECCFAKRYGKGHNVKEASRAVERSAVKILNRHSRVFAEYIYKDIEYWHRTLSRWMEKQKEDRHLGFGGLVAIYKSVTYICANSERDTSSRKLEDIIEELLGQESNFSVASVIGLVELISTGHVREEVANRVLHLVMKRFNAKRDSSVYMPLNLECISKYLNKSNRGKADYLIQIQRMAVAVIDNYPKTELNFKRYSLQALEKSFYNVDLCGSQELDDYLKEVIYQGLIRSCSYQIWAYAALQKEITGEETVSHKSFLPLWVHITNLASSNTDLEYFDNKSTIATKVLDAYISSFLKINKKLDLRFDVEYPYISNPETTAEASRPNDWKIFINNVNLFVDIMEESDDLHRMKKWLARILLDAIDSAYKSPMISEYYKIITACFKIADKIQFFDEVTVNEKTIQRFLWNVSLRVGQYKGDMQISCFETLLTAPAKLVEPFVKELIPVFQIILRVGSGHFPLLKECLATLEKWFKCLPKEQTEFLLKNILPYFDVFLQSKSEIESVSDLNVSKWKPLKSRGHVKKVHSTNIDGQLLYIQKKFLLFLGNLNLDVARTLIEHKREEEEEELSESVKNLTYDMPLGDRKLRIRVEFLPRIIELALSPGDRHTRLRACEFLHTMVTLTLGNMKHMNGELDGLFRKLVSMCLVLACDSDNKIFQIYELLATQMVHYFADRERNISETEIFIGCLMESVSHPYNSSLRDLAAKLVREFAKWSMKSCTTAGEISNNVKVILRNMYSLSIHPSHNERRGAAIVFNNIYTLIKDETDLLNTHWFLFYYYFIECLSMCTLQDDTSHIINAIELIKTSLRGKDLNTNPKVPSGFQDNSLNAAMTWIFRRCSHNNAKIRKLSMSIIEDFSKNSVQEFIKIHVIDIHMKREYLNADHDEEDYRRWLDHCSSFFDYYNWLLMQDALTEEDVKTSGMEELLGIFLDNLTINVDILDVTASVKALCIIHMFEFYASSVDRGMILYCEKILDIIKSCIFRPSKYKFEVCDFETREKLSCVMKILIPKLISVLKDSQIKYLLSADEYYSSVQRLGQYLQNREPLYEMIEFLNGLKMICCLGLWDAGPKQSVSGNDILHLVFNSIFFQRTRRCSGFLIEINDRIFLADFIKFAIDIGVSLEVIIDLLKNVEEVIEEETFRKTTKGEYFMNMFRDELCDYFIQNPERAVDEILIHFRGTALNTIFNTLNYGVASDLGFGYKEKFISELCQRWTKLEDLSDGNQTLLLSIVRSVCQIKPNVLIEDCTVRNWFFNVVGSTNVLEEVEIIFDLCVFVSPMNEDFNDRLTCILDELFKNLEFFTSKSDNPDPKVLISYKGLLNSFVKTRSLSVFQCMMKILRKYKKLLQDDEIEKVAANICQISSPKIPDEHLKRILSVLYEQLFNKDGTSDEVCECFIMKFLQKSDSAFGWNYLLEQLDDLLRVIKGENLIHKISALKIIQICVVKARKEELESMADEKKEAFRNCISICSKIPSADESEELRMYTCCCFNTLCTVISAKSNDKRLYKSLIFKDDFPFLPRIISQKKKWILSMDFDELPKRRKVFIALRKSITKERQIKLGKTISSVKYLQGETLFDSSLNEDVARFDFTSSIIRPLDSEPKSEVSGNHLDLEMDELNNHECMPTLVGLISHLVDEGITPSNPEILPFWLCSMINRMKSLNSSENEKIFIFKLMCNIDEYIKPYAEHIVPDILNSLLEVFLEKPINYLVIDLISMILNWRLDSSVLNRRLHALFAQLALYIVKKSDGYRKDIIKSNLEIAKLIIETCKYNMNLNALSVHAFQALETANVCTEGDKNVLNYLNFQFCGILLANSIPAWTDNKEEEFFCMVLGHFGNEKTGKIAAEICGLTLQHLKNSNYKNIDKLVGMGREKIHSIKATSDFNELPLIYAVYKSFPEFCSNFVASLRNSAWTLRGQFKVQSLEMILSHLKTASSPGEDMFGYTIYSFLQDMMSPDDFEALTIALQIVEVFTDKCEDTDMNEVFKKALSFGDYKITRVRQVVCNIASNLFEKLNSVQSSSSDDIKRICKTVLLNGINDKDADLSAKCIEFWYSRIRESKSSKQFAKILAELYTPETKAEFFNFAAKLMIRCAVNAPDYGKYVFEHPLVFNSNFQKKIISTTAYYSSVAPTFSMTLSGSLSECSFFRQENEDNSAIENGSGKLKYKRRFIRDTKKIKAYFAKKKREEEGDGARVSNNDIDLVREYQDGDYPFIQITHFDVLKPLEALTMKDPQIGRYFLTSIYDGFTSNITEETKDMISDVEGFVHEVFRESSSPDPAIVAFLFHILMHCNGQLKVNSGIISEVAKSSGWFSTGGLLVEELINTAEEEPSDMKRKKGARDNFRWVHLAELSRCSKEFEVLRGIFIDKLQVDGNACEAIRFESVSDWYKAATFYESALQQYEIWNDFYLEAYLNSLARLSDWTKLNNYLHNTYNVDDFWRDSSYVEKVLPWYMKSATIHSESTNAMVETISEIQKDPEKEAKLKKFFVEELTVFHFLNGDSQWAEYYLHRMCLNFLSTWSHWDKWSNNLRLSKLMKLQLMSEIDRCLKLYKEKTDTEVEVLTELWSRNGPEESDDLMNWDLKLTFRNHFLSKLRSCCPDLDFQQIGKSAMRLKFDLVKCGIAQGNAKISEKYLNAIELDLKIYRDHNLKFMYNYYRSSLQLLKGDIYEQDRSTRLKTIVDASSRIQRQMTNMMDTDNNSNHVFFYECNMKLSKVMHLLQSYESKSLGYAIRVLGLSRRNISEALKQKELEYLENARQVIEGADVELLSDAYIRIAKYHRRQIGYNGQLAKCLFRSMSLGNIEARQLFCCLVNEVKLASDWVADGEMKRYFQMVPIWMFLKWMNQLLANLDSKMFPFLKDVVWSLAEEYPNSMIFSFELSRNNYEYNHEHGDECRLFADRLAKKLSDVHHRNFLTALSFVATPDLVLKYHISKAFAELKTPCPKWDKVTGIVQDLYERIWGEESTNFRGPAFDCLDKKIKSDIELLLSSAGHEKSLWEEKLENIIKSKSDYNIDDTLKQYSPWLYNFQTTSQNIRIEIPGQYTGEHKPLVKHHTLISSFKQRVLVMNSKCKPIRISILGDNAQEYRFLVKFGEDLRQDQRIQQVFSQMNYILRKNQQTCGYSIDTYNVIPLKCNLGIIEWVNNTVSLCEMLTRANPSVRKTMEKVQEEHLAFLAQDNGVNKVVTAHLNGYMKINRETAIARFTERIYCFEWDLLRKAFWSLSTCPEHFAYLRKNFASTEAAIFISHWLIGIGDRHLDNTLVSSKTGRALGIDFGCAFGFATEFLTPPELVPFRLTPQIINLMKPLGSSGVIKEIMIHCLRAFGQEKSMLLAMLEVFASEPALDWLEKARRDNTFTNNSEWTPRKKIAMVKEKLEGVSPVKIFCDDLKAGHSSSIYLDKYLEVVQGEGTRSCESALTEDKQVECLIDLASDYHVLSKTYVGWNPWL